jgi:hypothetical protein
MTFRERNLAVFRRQPVDGVLWQPRIEHWYGVNKRQGTLPDRYRDMELLEVFDDLGCSVRAYWAYNPCLRIELTEEAPVDSRRDGPDEIVTQHTPAGDLTTVIRHTESAHQVRKYRVETPDDMKAAEWLLTHQRAWFDMEQFEKAEAMIGERAAPNLFIPRVNVMRLVVNFMGFENAMVALHAYPEETEHLIGVINESDEPVLDVLAESPVEIINYGDNVHQTLCPPPVFEQYVLPAYQRRGERLHAAGKKVFPHWDGDCKELLPYAQDCDFDGIEAVTPLPQGDVTLRETKEAMGGLILLDGIPATHFLPWEPEGQLIDTFRECVELFHPNLVLGISDEISPIGDIERVRLISELCREYASNAKG